MITLNADPPEPRRRYDFRRSHKAGREGGDVTVAGDDGCRMRDYVSSERLRTAKRLQELAAAKELESQS